METVRILLRKTLPHRVIVVCRMAQFASPIPHKVPVTWPQTANDLELLKVALDKVGLCELLAVPWNIKSTTLVEDFGATPIAEQFSGSIRGKTDSWNVDLISRAFHCSREGETGVSQRHPIGDAYFSGSRDSHGWKLHQCSNTELRILLKFVIPILHPTKATYCT